MAEPGAVIPPPPPGFVLDAQGDVPPPPAGFVLDTAQPTAAQAADAKLQKAATGAVEGAVNLATGSVAGPVAGLAGIAQGVKNLFSEGMPAGERVRQVQEGLTYQPQTPEGEFVQDVATAIPEKIAHGADVAGEAVSRVTGSPAIGAGVNTAIQAVPALLMKAAGPKAARAAALERERADVLAKVNQPKAEAILQARGSGLVLSPAEANPSLLNRVLEGVSGQAKVQQLASAKNQPVVQQIVRKSLGIRDDVPVTMESLEAVRKEAGQAYEKVRNVGEVRIDETYGKALDKIVEDYEGASKSFVEEKSAVQKAVDSARNTVKEGVFDSDAAVSKIKLERRRADTAFKNNDPELGKAHKAVADAIEAQIDRHIDRVDWGRVGESRGVTPEVGEFKKARQLIAKSYDVQKALKNGEIDARVLAQQLRKGKLSGDLKTLANVADKFPGSLQGGGKNAYTNVGAFDALMGVGAGGSALMHSPELGGAALAAAAAAAARPGIRSAITSGPYQRHFVNPQGFGRMTPELAAALTSDPAAAAAAGLQGHGFRTLEEELGRK